MAKTIWRDPVAGRSKTVEVLSFLPGRDQQIVAVVLDTTSGQYKTADLSELTRYE